MWHCNELMYCVYITQMLRYIIIWQYTQRYTPLVVLCYLWYDGIATGSKQPQKQALHVQTKLCAWLGSNHPLDSYILQSVPTSCKAC